jgi:hypothetical protein
MGTIPRRDGLAATNVKTSRMDGSGISRAPAPNLFSATKCEYVPSGPKYATSIAPAFFLRFPGAF